MKILNPKRLTSKFREGVTPIGPIFPRRYTLTHLRKSGSMFLTISSSYAVEQINYMRDEILAEWRIIYSENVFYLYCYIGGPFSKEDARERYENLTRDLPGIIEALRYGDMVFFEVHPELDKAPILVYFDSSYPEYNTIENWGTPGDYKQL